MRVHERLIDLGPNVRDKLTEVNQSGALYLMHRLYRYAILAALGWLAMAASPPIPETQRERVHAQRSIAESLQSIDASLKEANKPKEEAKPCNPAKPDRRSDLCAQWRAADAAVESAVWAEKTFYLGLIGTIIGALTLGAAVAAAYFAKDAAEHTARANLIASDVQRPWIKPKANIISVSPKGFGIRFSIWVMAENIGSMVAENVRFKAMVTDVEGRYFNSVDRLFSEWHNDMSDAEPGNILPGDESTIRISGDISFDTPNVYQKPKGRRLRVAVLIYCQYQVPGSKEFRYTQQCWILRRKEDWFRAPLPVDEVNTIQTDALILDQGGRCRIT